MFFFTIASPALAYLQVRERFFCKFFDLLQQLPFTSLPALHKLLSLSHTLFLSFSGRQRRLLCSGLRPEVSLSALGQSVLHIAGVNKKFVSTVEMAESCQWCNKLKALNRESSWCGRGRRSFGKEKITGEMRYSQSR